MFKGKVFILGIFFMFFLCFVSNSYAVTYIDSCQTIGAAGEYVLNTSITIAAVCFRISASDVILDLGGHTITNDLGDYAFYSTANYKNVTIRNGVADSWNYGIYYAIGADGNVNWTIDNIEFNNSNSYDIYFAGGGATQDKSIYLKNSKFNDTLLLSSIKNVYIDNVVFYGNSYLDINSVGNLSFDDDSGDVYFENVDFTTVGKLNGNGNRLLIRDFCLTDFSNIGGIGDNTFYLAEDLYHSTSACFTSLATNLHLDLDGHTLSNDGGDNAFIPSGPYQNVTIENGVLDGWNYAFYYNSASISNLSYHINNIEFRNSNSGDIYFVTAGSSYNQSILITNSKFTSILNFNSLKTVDMYGNNISSANDITVTAVGNFNASPLVDGSYVGNYWRDFTCSDVDDNYVVSYNGWQYNVCNSNDYTNNSIVDYAPLVGEASYVGLGGGAGSGSGSSGASSYDFGESLLGIVLLIGWFLFV